VAGFGQAFAPNIYVFIIIRTFGGIAAYGRFLSGYLLGEFTNTPSMAAMLCSSVIYRIIIVPIPVSKSQAAVILKMFLTVMEFVGPRNRAKMGSYLEFSWGISSMALPGVYYLVRHFQHMQVMSTVYELVASLCLFKLSESPRWLLTNGHYSKAHDIILKAATEKGKLTTEQIEAKLVRLKAFVDAEMESRKNEKKQSLLDVYRDPSLFKDCMLLYWLWFTMSFIGYGFALNIGDLGGNLFVNAFVASAGGMVAKGLLIYIVDRFTRKRLLFFAYLAGTGAFFVMAMVTNLPHVYMTICAFIGSSAIAIIIIVSYIVGTEIFPTTVRQTTMGSCGFVSRFGSISAPFMREVVSSGNIYQFLYLLWN